MQIKGAIFDMDGTLLDSLTFWDAYWRRVGEVYMGDGAFRPRTDIDKSVRTMILTDAMTLFYNNYKLPCTREEFIAFAGREIERFYRECAKPKDGAIELLRHLKEDGVKLCLASASEMQHIKIALAASGLDKYFELVLSCDDIKAGKDRPDIYLLAMRELGLGVSEICVFEDSFVAMETSKSIGFHTVGVYDKNNYEQDRLRAASDIYIGEGESLKKLAYMVNARR